MNTMLAIPCTTIAPLTSPPSPCLITRTPLVLNVINGGGGGGAEILVIDYSCFFLQQPGEETEERENLAQMAAEAVAAEGEEEDESVLRKYSKGISHVESLLALDRLRQVNPSCST